MGAGRSAVALLRFDFFDPEVELVVPLRSGESGHPSMSRPCQTAKRYPARSAGTGSALDCRCSISAICLPISRSALLQAMGTSSAREWRGADIGVSSIAAAWSCESAGEMARARRERTEMDFILEKELCEPSTWTAGLARIVLRKTFAERL